MTSASSLAGKVAVVTGAGRGIGQAIAQKFAEAGADLAICARTQSELDETRAAIEAHGQQCITGVVDLADPVSTKAFCDDVINAYGNLHVLVNNAGAYLERGTVLESDPDAWWKTVEVNICLLYTSPSPRDA